MVYGLWFRVLGSGLRVQGFELGVQALGFRVQVPVFGGLESRV